MADQSNSALIVSPKANQAVVRLEGDEIVFESVPRWLLAAHGNGSRLPPRIAVDELRGHPLRALGAASMDMLSNGFPLRDYYTELPTDEGEALCILMDGTVEKRGGEEVAILDLQDVSGIVRERRRAAAVGAFHGIVGQSLPMLEVYQRILLYSQTQSPVIITGETGTGKELVARALHDRSPRAEKPFVAVNCTALTPELFESELFGHEKGSFTGAYRQHRGRFERADEGTLFLDEIGDMPPMTQAKMLRALEEGVIERVGGEAEREVDVRVIAATNIPLEYAVATGRFRSDLYHRLSVFRIHLPPLRERHGDLPMLVDHYIQIFNRRYDRGVKRLTPEAMRLLHEYPWPGNIRELRNVMERLFVETRGEAIGANALARWINERDALLPGSWNVDAALEARPLIVPQAAGGYAPGGNLPVPRAPEHYPVRQPSWPAPTTHYPVIDAREPVVEHPAEEQPDRQELTEENIRRAFRSSGGNITKAAERLGVHKATLYRHMKQLGLTREDLREAGGDSAEEQTDD